jgi:superfamily II RNA helicase
MDEILKVLSGGVDVKENDFNIRNSVLMEYKIIDSELNLLFKGKVAERADSLILCELFFSGLITSLTDCELLAILSIFCLHEKAGGSVEDCEKQYSENFTKASDFIYSETEKLIALEAEKGIITEENTIEKRTNYKFYEMIYDWADQKAFKDVIENSTIDEGIIVKMIMSVNRQR